jgi:Na+-translocating ferredoxin:NAD+ oxidoreductase subunit G
MREVVRLALPLLVIGLLAGLAIGFVRDKAMHRIAAQEQAAEEAALAAVLPAGARPLLRHGSGALPPRYWVAQSDSASVVYAFEVASRGYAGDVHFMVAVDTAGTVMGLQVLSQTETPGLGARMTETSSRRFLWNPRAAVDGGRSWFTQQFLGVNVVGRIAIARSDEWHALSSPARERLRAANAVTAITGATATTRAIVRGLEGTVFTYIRALRKGA